MDILRYGFLIGVLSFISMQAMKDEITLLCQHALASQDDQQIRSVQEQFEFFLNQYGGDSNLCRQLITNLADQIYDSMYTTDELVGTNKQDRYVYRQKNLLYDGSEQSIDQDSLARVCVRQPAHSSWLTLPVGQAVNAFFTILRARKRRDEHPNSPQWRYHLAMEGWSH